MAKKQQTFQFDFPLRKKEVRDLRIVTVDVGSLRVIGTGCLNPYASSLDPFSRYAAEITSVDWMGQDIKPVLEVTGGMEEIQEEALRFVAYLFEKEVAHA